MGEFKVGDKVKRFRHSGKIYNCPIGFETIVDEVFPNKKGFWYHGEDGSRMNSNSLEDWKIVDNSGPVRTVTRKEIVPGHYDVVQVLGVKDGLVQIRLNDDPDEFYSASEIRAAIATLTELADALDEA